MNLSTIIVLIIILAALALAIKRIIKKGVPCSCESENCANCGCCCHKKDIKE